MAVVKRLKSIQDIDMSLDLWVFGYGSLIWLQNFEFDEKRKASLAGFHRDFCVLSFTYRGTRENPGLVLGLKQGGYCSGIAFRLSKDKLSKGLADIWKREIVSDVYFPSIVELSLAEPEQVVDA
ncbi:MAG: gamma-glutamylcyclotransferase [Cellvibrionaceae bacterium]|nr:gamma-glutamylcyclotransferase [Cellvibrionaceae bacterium]